MTITDWWIDWLTNLLTDKFFDIWASKSDPNPSVFYHFHLQMRFAPQRRAIFGHRNDQSRSRAVVFCAFWLTNVLRATSGLKIGPTLRCFVHFDLKTCFATAACHFWTSELQKLVRACGVLCVLTWKCASGHSGVPFFISLLNSCLRTPL